MGEFNFMALLHALMQVMQQQQGTQVPAGGQPMARSRAAPQGYGQGWAEGQRPARPWARPQEAAPPQQDLMTMLASFLKNSTPPSTGALGETGTPGAMPVPQAPPGVSGSSLSLPADWRPPVPRYAPGVSGASLVPGEASAMPVPQAPPGSSGAWLTGTDPWAMPVPQAPPGTHGGWRPDAGLREPAWPGAGIRQGFTPATTLGIAEGSSGGVLGESSARNPWE